MYADPILSVLKEAEVFRLVMVLNDITNPIITKFG